MEGIYLSELQNLSEEDQIEQQQLSYNRICHKITWIYFLGVAKRNDDALRQLNILPLVLRTQPPAAI